MPPGVIPDYRAKRKSWAHSTPLKKKIKGNKELRDSTEDKQLALHMVNLGSNFGTPYDLLRTTRVIPWFIQHHV